MSRWIDKVITRHLEPEHNVRPFPGGIFHAVAGEPPAFSEEGIPGAGEDMTGRNERKGLPGEENIQQSKDDVLREDNIRVRQSAEKVVKSEGRELNSERTILEGHEKKKMADMADKEMLEIRRIAKGEESAVPGTESVMKGEDSSVTGVGKKPDGDDAGVKGPPVIQGKVRPETVRPGPETRIKYMTRGAPVLSDIGEVERMEQKGSEEGKGAMRVPGIVQRSSTFNVFRTNVSPAAAERQQVHVSIGRIEIKAVIPPAETKMSPVKKDTSVMGLDQYLEQRNPAKQ